MANKIKYLDVNPFLQTLMESRQLLCSSRAVKCQLSCSSCPVLNSWSLGDDNQSNNIDSITSLQFPFRFPGYESPSDVDVIPPLVKHLWSSAPTPVFMTLVTTTLWPTWYHHHLAWRVRFWNSQAFMSSFYDVIKLPLTLKLWKNICLRDFDFRYMTSGLRPLKTTFDTCTLVVYFSDDIK